MLHAQVLLITFLHFSKNWKHWMHEIMFLLAQEKANPRICMFKWNQKHLDPITSSVSYMNVSNSGYIWHSWQNKLMLKAETWETPSLAKLWLSLPRAHSTWHLKGSAPQNELSWTVSCSQKKKKIMNRQQHKHKPCWESSILDNSYYVILAPLTWQNTGLKHILLR